MSVEYVVNYVFIKFIPKTYQQITCNAETTGYPRYIPEEHHTTDRGL